MEYKKNTKLEVTITDMGMQGEGIGKVDGYTLFVKDAMVGDTIEALITKPKKNYAYARCEKVLKPSPFRIEPVCKLHKKCGGCQLMAMDYKKQLMLKTDKVKNNLIRLGGFDADFVDRVTEPIIGMDDPYRYRNKAQYPIGTDKEGNPIAGFYAGRTHSIIANTDCHLEHSCNDAILRCILDFMKEYKIPAYQEESHKGLVRHVLIRTGFTTGQVMVCLVINGKSIKNSEILVERLLALDCGIESVSLSVNTEKTNVIMGIEIIPLYGKGYITDYIKDLAFQISPLSFFQVNPVQTQKLYQTALDYAGLTGKETVWDLYCGIGTISLFLARNAKNVCGVEIIPQAIEDAKRNAALNGIENAQFFVGKAEEVLPNFYEDMQKKDAKNAMLHPDVIVVDPPRKGCDEVCLDTMLKMQPDKIVYVSCDSATLARDLQILCNNGYQIERVRPCDMFPHTVHVESVVLITRKDE